MLKALLHITLITALFMQQLQMVVVCAVFKAQQSYLTKNECVNRNNPHNECKAHCQLSKRISEQEKKESTNEIPFKEQTEFVAGFEKTTLKKFQANIPKQVWKMQSDEKFAVGFHRLHFQPPES